MQAFAEDARHPVHRHGARAGDFRQAAGGGTARQLHLEQPVARVQVAQRCGGIRLGGGMDARNAPAVQGDVHRFGQAGYVERVVGGGERQPDCGGGGQRQQDAEG